MGVEGIEIRGPEVPGAERVATDEALAFVAMLVRRFGPARDRLLRRRRETQERLRASRRPPGSGTTPGPWRPPRPISPTAGWRSPARSSGR
jgi:malate synthase